MTSALVKANWKVPRKQKSKDGCYTLYYVVIHVVFLVFILWLLPDKDKPLYFVSLFSNHEANNIWHEED